MNSAVNLTEIIVRVETRYIKAALRTSGGSRTVAATLLGIKRTTLVEKMKKYGLLHEIKSPSTGPRSHCNSGHPLTEDSVYVYYDRKRGQIKRRCKVCIKEKYKKDAIKHVYEKQKPRTHCSKGHELTRGNSYVRKRGKKGRRITCRECTRQWHLRQKRKNSGAQGGPGQARAASPHTKPVV